MSNLDHNILMLFQKEPYTELSTTEIISIIQKNQHDKLQLIIDDKYSSNDAVKQAKFEKKKLQRQLLYHLNKLVDSGLLKVSKTSPKGQKYFVLGIDSGERVYIDKHNRMHQHISKPNLPHIPLGEHERSGVVAKYEKEDWLGKVNSIFLESNMFTNLREISDIIELCFQNINDCVCLHNFETLVAEHDIEDVVRFLTNLNTNCQDFDKASSCSITLKNVINDDKFIELLQKHLKIKNPKINFIFNVSKEDINTKLFENIIELLSSNHQDFFIRNNDVSNVPYFMGNAGPYTIDQKDWQHYKQEFKDKLYGFVISQATLLLDMNKLFSKRKDTESFAKIIKKLMFVFNESNDAQRMLSRQLFPELFKLDKEKGDFLIFSRNLVRLWNYGWKNPDFDRDFLIEYLEIGFKMVKEFSKYQEIVYKCSGMPTRMSIALASAYRDSVQSVFTSPNFLKFKIRSITDLQKPENKETMAVKEKLSDLLDGGDMMSFYRSGTFDTKSLKNEIQYIFNHFKLPFFRYNFGEVKDQNITLEKFM
ncbi:hypothetical protein KY325_00530 [Candidatus Woesearchaeota archaeon]|nr:hypothetical protein [Candidatus Woesearchaeota archaeon]MBW3017629.1 hypothetical protein [Candidatus Woesearchaeota archaeon]